MERKNTSRCRKHRVPDKMDTNRSTPRHTVIKMSKLKDKKRVLKVATEKQIVLYKGMPIRLLTDFSVENLQAKME